MPYILPEDRTVLDEEIKALAEKLKTVPQDQLAGAINYSLTKLLQTVLEGKQDRYNVHNSLIGMFECCKMEWYRERVAPYEDIKKEENGDV